MTPIGLLDANDQLIQVDFDGWAGYLGVSWNEAGGFWTLSVRKLDSDRLLSGLPLSPMWPLLAQVRRASFPPGEIVVDTYLDALDRRSFADGRAVLLYLAPDDIADVVEAAARLRAPVREGVSATAAPRTAGGTPFGYVGPPDLVAGPGAPAVPGAAAVVTADDLQPLTDDSGDPLEF